MAEAPPNGLFWFAADEAARRAELDGDRVVIDMAAHGPAGVSSVDLPGGGLLQVDHLDPSRLLGVESDVAQPGGSALLGALFGSDGALRITDRDRSPDHSDPDLDDEDIWSAGRTPRRVAQLDQDAQRAGRLVVLADLTSDPAADPLARALAAAELIASLDATPGGDLFGPIVPNMVDHALAAASQVDDDLLVSLDRKLAFRITSALRPLVAAAPTGAARSMLSRLVERIESLAGGEPPVHIAASLAPSAPSFADEFPEDEIGSPTPVHAARVSAPTVRFVRRSPSVLEVRAPRSEGPRWVRALRTDGLVTVALAPLHGGGLHGGGSTEFAELVVPPDTATGDLGLQLVPADELHQLAGAPADLVRRAVRAGRAATSAERSGDRPEAMQRWRRCAALWRRVGDDRRARQAADRGTSRGGRVLVGPILADELDPYGTDAHLEQVDAR